VGLDWVSLGKVSICMVKLSWVMVRLPNVGLSYVGSGGVGLG
jgi:K+ transporter